MGLSDQTIFETGGETFSRDVLRLEICGKDQDHLSVIDVPGIFKKTTAGVTKKTDITLVRSMVHGYMVNPRSVMLTVVPANADVANQEILELASEVDKDDHRTLGVLTKPNLVDKGAENKVADLVEGRSHVLTLGWHMVRNLGQKEMADPSCDRYAMENDFFSVQQPWCTLEKERLGIRALRRRLQQILAGHIRREFPKVYNRKIHRYPRRIFLFTDITRSNRRSTRSSESVNNIFERSEQNVKHHTSSLATCSIFR